MARRGSSNDNNTVQEPNRERGESNEILEDQHSTTGDGEASNSRLAPLNTQSISGAGGISRLSRPVSTIEQVGQEVLSLKNHILYLMLSGGYGNEFDGRRFLEQVVRLQVQGAVKDRDEQRKSSNMLRTHVDTFTTTLSDALALNNWTAEKEKTVEVCVGGL